MLSKLVDGIIEYFKAKPSWNRLQPVFIMVGIYAFALALAYKFLDWRYQISPPFKDFLGSYIFHQITLIFAAFVVILLLFVIQDRLSKEEKGAKFSELLRGSLRRVSRRLAIVGIVLVIFVPIFAHISPAKVKPIRIVFLDEPDFNRYAFLYVIYELNRVQGSWRFKVDLDTFDDSRIEVMDKKRCSEQRERALCCAMAIAHDEPLIAITSENFDRDHFWQNEGQVSAISTFKWNEVYAPPGIYEYLAYSVIAQSITIHLNAQGRSLIPGKKADYGDWLQVIQRRNAMKAEILCGHLSREGENLLMNAFGAEYMTTCSKLLRLDWLRSERVVSNLKTNFKVDF